MSIDNEIRILVAGSRTITDIYLVEYCICNAMDNFQILDAGHIDAFIVGGARGVDTLAEEIADDNDIPKMVFPAKWRVDGKFIRGAGHIRNAEMAKHMTHAILIQEDNSPGTKHMLSLVVKKGIPYCHFILNKPTLFNLKKSKRSLQHASYDPLYCHTSGT